MNIAKLILLTLTTIGLLMVSQLGHSRHAAILIDADNGNVLYELEPNQAWYPASLTKLMTLYMTFEALESGRFHLTKELNVSSHAAKQPTSKLGLRTWDSITVEDAVIAIITRSANDAAVVLAEAISGNERQFAIKMTTTAHRLGMLGSHFMNATGLPHDWQTTSAHDMGLLAMRIIRDFPQYYGYFGMESFFYNGRELRGINKFVSHYPGAEGMKTGYTCGSGYNLVASANQYGKRLIGVVLGGMTSSERYEHMFMMMDMGFSNRSYGYRSKNINTMNNNSVGFPPYQLPCGHRPSSHYATRSHDEDDDDDKSIQYVKKYADTHLFSTRPKLANNLKPVTAVKPRPIVKPHAVHLAKLESKNLHAHSHNAHETTIETTRPITLKSKVAKTSGSHPTITKINGKKNLVLAKNNKTASESRPDSHKKGYYVPTGKQAAKTSRKTEITHKPASKPNAKPKGKSKK